MAGRILPVHRRPARPRRHRRGDRAARAPAQGRARLAGALSVPRRALAQLHGEPGQAVLPLLRLRRARQRDPLPDGLRPLWSSSTRSRSWRAAPASPCPTKAAARRAGTRAARPMPCSRRRPPGSRPRSPPTRVRAPTSSVVASARTCAGGSGWATHRATGTACARRSAARPIARRNCCARACWSRAAATAVTTASATASCSRSWTGAAGRSPSAAACWRPAMAPST